MNSEITYSILLALGIILLFSIAEFLHHKIHIKTENTRKLVHFGTGLITLLFPILLNNHWWVLLLCSSFAVILLLSIRLNILKSINAIDRVSAGSIAYPIAVYGCYLAYHFHGGSYLFYYLPILILAICDPIAALTGSKWPVGEYSVGAGKKTLTGSAFFFLFAVGLCFGLSWAFEEPLSMWHWVFIAISATFSEAISKNGYDNLTIPASVLISMLLIENWL